MREGLSSTDWGKYSPFSRELVNHEILRETLKGLTRLKKLAICRDTYRTHDIPDVEGYYSERNPDGAWDDDARARHELEMRRPTLKMSICLITPPGSAFTAIACCGRRRSTPLQYPVSSGFTAGSGLWRFKSVEMRLPESRFR